MRNRLKNLARFLKTSYKQEYKLLTKLAFVDKSYYILNESNIFNLISYNFKMNEKIDKDIWLNEFMDLNSEVFVEYPLLKELGQGAFGIAFETEDGSVMKIFAGAQSYLDYIKRKKEQDMERSSKYDVKIYDIGMFTLPKYKRPKYVSNYYILGWVVMEKLSVLSDADNDAWRVAYSIISKYLFKNNLIHNIDSISDKDFQQHIDNLINIVKKEFKTYAVFNNEKEEDASNDNIEEFIWFVISSYRKGHDDMKSDNIGLRDKTPVGFDTKTPDMSGLTYQGMFSHRPELNIEYDDDK